MTVTYAWKPVEKIKQRMDPAFWDPKYDELDVAIFETGWPVKRLGDFIGSITYGQVGQRVYDLNGTVWYVQVRNLVRTGIDVLAKPARIAEGSYNDPVRSRVAVGDILYANSGIGSLGRCVCITELHDEMNVSQDIDVIRVDGVLPEYIASFLMSKLGQAYSLRISHGVSRMTKISFVEVKSLPVPVLPLQLQEHIRDRYRQVARTHDAAMKAKAAGKLAESQETLDYANRLLDELVAYVEGVIQAGPPQVEVKHDGETR
ncbi:MAG: hypothetical protein FJ280_25850 [Planctomycetes bacterium]|nr:hypothetical protein [Planctomycetota bacterium]